jgi:hypothetical protein
VFRQPAESQPIPVHAPGAALSLAVLESRLPMKRAGFCRDLD